MFTLGLHNQGIIAFNLVTHIVYYDTTTETGQAMLRGASVHASRGDLQQSRHHYLQLGDTLQVIAWPDFLSFLIYGRAYPKVLAPPKKKKKKKKKCFWDFIIFSFVDPPVLYFWREITFIWLTEAFYIFLFLFIPLVW